MFYIITFIIFDIKEHKKWKYKDDICELKSETFEEVIFYPGLMEQG